MSLRVEASPPEPPPGIAGEALIARHQPVELARRPGCPGWQP